MEITKQLIKHGASSVQIVTRSSEKYRAALKFIKQDVDLADCSVSLAVGDFYQENLEEEIFGPADNKNGTPRFNTLINCAGLSQTSALIVTGSTDISKILRVNLEAPIRLSQRLLSDYFTYGRSLSKDSANTNKEETPFCVINISSLLAARGGYGSSVYASAKAGLVAFTRTLTLEAAAMQQRNPKLPPFRANVVLPGYIDTPMIQNFSEKQNQKLRQEIPLNRYGLPEEVADAVLFLLKNEYANNTVLNLDGGLSAT